MSCGQPARLPTSARSGHGSMARRARCGGEPERRERLVEQSQDNGELNLDVRRHCQVLEIRLIFDKSYKSVSYGLPDQGSACTATPLEAVGTTQNMNGEKMLDKMLARCVALNVASGEKKYIDVPAFSPTATRPSSLRSTRATSTARSRYGLRQGHHHGRYWKYKGITGKEPFACIAIPALDGPGGDFAMDIPHNTTWVIK